MKPIEITITEDTASDIHTQAHLSDLFCSAAKTLAKEYGTDTVVVSIVDEKTKKTIQTIKVSIGK